MKPLTACLALTLAALLPAGTARAHSCHPGWQQSGSEGWHRHGRACEPQKGLGVSTKEKKRQQNRTTG